MPTEHIRQRVANNPALYPQLARVGPQQNNGTARDPISIGSTASTTSSAASSVAPRTTKPTARRGNVVYSSDEESLPIARHHRSDDDDDESDEDEHDDDEAEVVQRIGLPPNNHHVPDPQPQPQKGHSIPIGTTRPNPGVVRDLTKPKPPTTATGGNGTGATWKNPPVPVAAPTAARSIPSSSQYPQYPGRPGQQASYPAQSAAHPSNNYVRPAVGFAERRDQPPSPYNAPFNAFSQTTNNTPFNAFAQTTIPEWMDPKEAEKAVRDLLEGNINDGEDEEHVEIDMTQAIVPGFKEGFELLPHQILGRQWMKGRECAPKFGGILADDMGLGKTIQTLTRIVEGKAKLSDKNDGWSASTLVICPLALVGQWAEEIERMTENIRVLKHQGQSRTNDPAVLRKHHVVVTTYDTVKSEYDAYSGGGGASSKSKKKSSNGAADDDSEEEEQVKKPAKKTTKKSAIFGVKWWRVVLDEAHNIKNHKTKGAIACCALEAKWRWCLTGTPMQNNVTELYSLIKFLHIKPLNDWDTFNNQIAKPVANGRGAQRAMQRLQVILKNTMLRRQKTQKLNGKVLIELPARNVSVVSCAFDAQEKAFYDSLETKMKDTLDKLLEASKQQGNSAYMSVLLLFLRLRQACNHQILVTKDYKQDVDAIESTAVPKGADDKEADEATDDLVAAFGQLGVTRKCQMCTSELKPGQTGEGPWKTHCIGCVPLAQQAKKAEAERPSSAKIRKVLELLKTIEERSGGTEKTIIFSQFTTMLDLLEPFLKDRGVKYVRYDGKMKPAEREASLNEIKTSKTTRVILISFKAGSTGLNLTACNNVILVDLWWNPALEDQAFDRAHRLGQTRDVHIFKLKIDETVEDRILLLQDKKRLLAAAALSGDKIKGLKLTMDDLLAMFRGNDVHDDEED